MKMAKKEKIGIVGLWTGKNFGAVLTAWALYCYLDNNGFEPYLIDFLNGINSQSEAGMFIRSRCRVRLSGETFNDLQDLNDEMDIFMVGSDQCWRGRYDGGWIKEYSGFKFFLNFTAPEKKRISYATSCGVSEFEGTEEEVKLSLKYLKRFNSISIREKETAGFYSKQLGMDVAWTIDPIYLIGKDSFAKIGKESVRKCLNEKYVLGFFLDLYDNRFSCLNKVSQELGLKEYIVAGGDYINYAGKSLENVNTDVSVSDFISAIYNAEYIVTDSYHCMCFAVMFHKPFSVVVNKDRGKERFISFSDYLGLESRCFLSDSVENYESEVNKTIDWSEVDSRLASFVDSSKNWLKRALEQDCESKKIKSQICDDKIIVAELEDRYLYQKYENIYLNNKINELKQEIQDLRNYSHMIEEYLERFRGARLKKFIDNKLDQGDIIAIRGAGDHTERLLKLIDSVLKEKEIIIKYIVDKKEPEFIMPAACLWITPEMFITKEKEVNHIIVSSSRFGRELVAEISEFCEKSKIIDLKKAFLEGEMDSFQGWYDL